MSHTNPHRIFPPHLPAARGTAPGPNVFAWQDIECFVPDRADKTRELGLLNGISGAAQTSDLVAIIGKIVCRV